MSLVSLELSEIIESSTIVREATQGRIATQVDSARRLQQNDTMALSGRERVLSPVASSEERPTDNVNVRLLRAEANNSHVNDSLSSLHLQVSRVNSSQILSSSSFGSELRAAVHARRERLYHRPVVEDTRVRSRARITENRAATTLARERFDGSIVEQIREFLDNRRLTRSARGGSSSSESLSSALSSPSLDEGLSFDGFVAAEFPLPSYEEALKLPSVPEYSPKIDKLKMNVSELPLYVKDRFRSYSI